MKNDDYYNPRFDDILKEFINEKDIKKCVFRFHEMRLIEQILENPDNVVFLTRLAVLYRENKVFDKSLEFFDKALKLSEIPKKYDIMYEKAILFKDIEKYRECMDVLIEIPEDYINTSIKGLKKFVQGLL